MTRLMRKSLTVLAGTGFAVATALTLNSAPAMAADSVQVNAPTPGPGSCTTNPSGWECQLIDSQPHFKDTIHGGN